MRQEISENAWKPTYAQADICLLCAVGNGKDKAGYINGKNAGNE